MPLRRMYALAVVALGMSAFCNSLMGQYGPQAAPTAVTTVNSAGESLRTGATGLRIVVRDTDAPDQPIDQVCIVLVRSDSIADRGGSCVSTNERGVVALSALAGGDYAVSVRRVGYHEARFTIRVRSKCAQILEVYVTNALFPLDRCQVRTAGAPPCDPAPPPTPSRAVLTTCAHAA